ncbi:hypothetical protein SAMN05443287_11212 [Micromonospora phaseoli]|uniref:Uncharacterized protein n=1 Tax=Micromonospora phaseoli TaxID=1144548 RepID=A0A1H7DD44_9ACTN|nr:hypothetical protein CLV64_11213 [Micromonospora phaseoli]GIJ77543.1 hypothetical protein Xph01_19750 [Micromonospora phaseoli]SEJ97110.1 hypothetical protein SAMN05443287_11212 [Micromonospora phaseoli]
MRLGRRVPPEAPGHDFVCVRSDQFLRSALPRAAVATPEPVMSRYVAPLGFTLAAVWVAVLFVLASGTH